MKATQRAQLLSDVAERVALLNEFRTDDFRDRVVGLVSDARESWRGADALLPPSGADPGLDALIGIADAADGPPIAVRDACAAALRAAEDAGLAR